MTLPPEPPEPPEPPDEEVAGVPDADPIADLVAYLDGELDEADAQAVEVRVNTDAGARRDLETFQRTWDLLDYLPRAEPSPTFTSRTLERIEGLPGVARGSGPAPALSAPTPPVPGRHRGWRGWAAVAAGAAACFAAGYGLTDLAARLRPVPPAPPGPRDLETLSVAEVRLLERLPQYHAVDDIDFLKALAQPELFGDDAAGR
jgi:anti-sigma factor RsiW